MDPGLVHNTPTHQHTKNPMKTKPARERMHLYIDKPAAKEIKRLAKRHNLTYGEVVSQLVDQYRLDPQ